MSTRRLTSALRLRWLRLAAAGTPAVTSVVLTTAGVRAEESSSPRRHCAERSDSRWVATQALGVQSAPLGAELELRLGVCWPMIDSLGPLSDFSNAKLGVLSQATAGYANTGLFAEVSPLSIFGLRLSAAHVQYFPAGLTGTGYIALPEDNGSFRVQDFPESGQTRAASGYNLTASAWLAIELELAPGIAAFAYDELGLEHWSLGKGPYYYNSRWNLVMGARDELLRNDAFAGASLKLSPELALQLGALSAYRAVPGAPSRQLRVGGAGNVTWVRPESALRTLTAFLGFGYPLRDARQFDPTLWLALGAGWDLGGS